MKSGDSSSSLAKNSLASGSNSIQISLLTNTNRLRKYAPAQFRPSVVCPICCSKNDCPDHPMVLTLSDYSFDLNPLLEVFMNRLRGSVCTVCQRIYVKFSQLRRKGSRISCKLCKSKLVSLKINKKQITAKENGLEITDVMNRKIKVSDLCFGSSMLMGPFMYKIPSKYLSKPPNLFGFIFYKKHAFSSLYSRIHRRDSWIRSQIISRRTKYSSRCVITPSKDYANATMIYLPRIVARNRGLKENDLVMVNRHPTLHVESFVVLRCKIWEEITAGISTAQCPCLAADFDGDMINVMALNSYEEQAEALCLMYPETVFVNPPGNTNMLGVTQHMTYVFRFPKNLELLQQPVYFQCPSFEYNHGKCQGVLHKPITRSHLNHFLTHVYFQTGAKNAVRVFNQMAKLTHETLSSSIRGIRLSDLLEFKTEKKQMEEEKNLFLIQPRHEIKGDLDNVKKMLSNFSSTGYWMGSSNTEEIFQQSKIARSRLTDAVTLIALSGWDFKKLAISLMDLTISYWGNVCTSNKRSLTYDLEFYFNYLNRTCGVKEVLTFALKAELAKNK